MHVLTELIRKDMKPALGVTEPGAIAFAVSTARTNIAGNVEKVKVRLNSGMYKNAYTCGIPNSAGYGNLHAAALGAVAAKPELGLESLAHITPNDDKEAEELVRQGRVEVVLDHIGSEIFIEAIVSTNQGQCRVCIRGGHTDIHSIEKNGTIVFEKQEEKESEEEVREQNQPLIHQYTLKEMLSYVHEIPLEELLFIENAYEMNMQLLEEGLASEKTTIGPMLQKDNRCKLVSEDELKTAQLFCNGAIEARVLGLNKPAMSITGSGAHGIIATMPLYASYQVTENTKQRLLRGTALSFLITMYIKEYSGKLSAFCGCGIAAGAGMACGLAFMKGAGELEIQAVIQNMATGLTGMICDGGNQGCTMKGIVSVDAAFRSVHMAMNGTYIDAIHGIAGKTPEETMRNMGLIASPGMTKTEETIIEIMQHKG